MVQEGMGEFLQTWLQKLFLGATSFSPTKDKKKSALNLTSEESGSTIGSIFSRSKLELCLNKVKSLKKKMLPSKNSLIFQTTPPSICTSTED